jgi:hypothetical protein
LHGHRVTRADREVKQRAAGVPEGAEQRYRQRLEAGMRDAHRARAGEGAPKVVRPVAHPARHLFRVRSDGQPNECKCGRADFRICHRWPLAVLRNARLPASPKRCAGARSETVKEFRWGVRGRRLGSSIWSRHFEELGGTHQEARGGLFISDGLDPILQKSPGNAPLGAETSR